MAKVFLDTNIVVDFLCERGEFYLPAARIVVKAYHKEIELCCSSLTFATASYLMGKSKLDSATIFQKIASFCTLCTPTIVDQTTINEALHSEFTDFEDAMQYFSARRFGADVIGKTIIALQNSHPQVSGGLERVRPRITRIERI